LIFRIIALGRELVTIELASSRQPGGEQQDPEPGPPFGFSGGSMCQVEVGPLSVDQFFG